MSKQYQNLFIISGPSGAGEDSIITGLEKFLPLERVVTTTARVMRTGESQGNPYYFISPEEFESRLARGEFVEYARQYNSNFYGVTRKELDRVEQSGKVGVWKIEYKGVMTVKKLFPEIPAIFVTVPSLDILEQRIRRRDADVSDAYVAERMAYTREWMKHVDIYDFTVVNEEGKLIEAIHQTAAIIESFRKK